MARILLMKWSNKIHHHSKACDLFVVDVARRNSFSTDIISIVGKVFCELRIRATEMNNRERTKFVWPHLYVATTAGMGREYCVFATHQNDLISFVYFLLYFVFISFRHHLALAHGRRLRKYNHRNKFNLTHMLDRKLEYAASTEKTHTMVKVGRNLASFASRLQFKNILTERHDLIGISLRHARSLSGHCR